MDSISKIFFLLVLISKTKLDMAESDVMSILEERFENKISESTNYMAKWLEDFNDRHLRNSEIGKILRYNDLKSKFGTTALEGKGMKKMSMALIPIIFHVGATSTWMILTSIMTVKSVAIGLLLLVFKIAVSSAKVASYFTTLKIKNGDHHGWSSSPYYEHHGQLRSLTDLGPHSSSSWSSYLPEGHDSQAYSSYKSGPPHEDHLEKRDYKNTIIGPYGHF